MVLFHWRGDEMMDDAEAEDGSGGAELLSVGAHFIPRDCRNPLG